jgi:hypothetical protein
VEVLLQQIYANSADKALLVQVGGQFDNRDIFECRQRFLGCFAA